MSVENSHHVLDNRKSIRMRTATQHGSREIHFLFHYYFSPRAAALCRSQTLMISTKPGEEPLTRDRFITDNLYIHLLR